MSSQNIREMELPGQPKISVVEVEFETVKEDWNEYALADGTKLRVKNVLTRVFMQVDEHGAVIYNEHGEPNVIITGNQVVTPMTRVE